MPLYQGVCPQNFSSLAHPWAEKSAAAKFLCRAWKLILSRRDQNPSWSAPGMSWLKKIGKNELDLVGPPTY